MVKYIPHNGSNAHDSSSCESQKGKSAAMEKATTVQIRKIARKRLAARTKFQKNIRNKVKSCSQSFRTQLPVIMKVDQISCSICYEILVGPVLLSCGHIFCLNCLDRASFLNGQCPLCRHSLDGESYKPSKQLMTLIDNFIAHTFNEVDHKNYLKRVKEFEIIERKRLLPKSLKVGDYVDLNVNQKWVSAQIKGFYNTYMTLKPICKGEAATLNIDVTSRRIASQFTFTKEPPLKPTYYTADFNYHEPVLRYIVEPPSFTRRVPRREANLVINPIEQRREWDHFEPIRQSNNWLADDVELPSLDLQSLQLDENELLLGN